jgi:hypothetical protein
MNSENAPREPTPEELQHWESRAPGWQIRCRKCGFTEPFGKYGIRLAAAGTACTIGFCRRCRWLRFQVIERKDAPAGAAQSANLRSFRTIGLIGLAVTIALNLAALLAWQKPSAKYFSDAWWGAWFPSYVIWLVFAAIGFAGCCRPKPGDMKNSS